VLGWQDLSEAKVPILVLKAGLIRQTDRICHIDEAAFITEFFKKPVYLD
jgi:hypothetical protein